MLRDFVNGSVILLLAEHPLVCPLTSLLPFSLAERLADSFLRRCVAFVRIFLFRKSNLYLMQRFLLPFAAGLLDNGGTAVKLAMGCLQEEGLAWGHLGLGCRRRENSHRFFLTPAKRFLTPTKTNFGAMLGRGRLKCWRCVKCLDSSRDDDGVGGDEDLGA